MAIYDTRPITSPKGGAVRWAEASPNEPRAYPSAPGATKVPLHGRVALGDSPCGPELVDDRGQGSSRGTPSTNGRGERWRTTSPPIAGGHSSVSSSSAASPPPMSTGSRSCHSPSSTLLMSTRGRSWSSWPWNRAAWNPGGNGATERPERLTLRRRLVGARSLDLCPVRGGSPGPEFVHQVHQDRTNVGGQGDGGESTVPSRRGVHDGVGDPGVPGPREEIRSGRDLERGAEHEQEIGAQQGPKRRVQASGSEGSPKRRLPPLRSP